MATSEKPNGRGEYGKSFYFREKEYRSLESLVEAFAESEESWSDALVAVGRGYIRKWLESNDDFGRAMEMEKHAEKSPEEQLQILLRAHAPGSVEKVRSWMKSVVTPEKRLATPDRSLVTLEKDGSELLLIPAGEYEMGEREDPDYPKHRVFLDAYYISAYCVTNAQYALFVKETEHRPPDEGAGDPVWEGNWYPPEKANHPVVCVTWEDAMAYAMWAGCDLPTEAQWEKAARGPKGYVYPWGNEWDGTKCQNSVGKNAEGTTPVDAYPQGKSGYGTYQQVGNVWEWCSDWYDEYYYKRPKASRNPKGPSRGLMRMIRGGSWGFVDPLCFRGASRLGLDPSFRNDNLGFRLARTP